MDIASYIHSGINVMNQFHVTASSSLITRNIRKNKQNNHVTIARDTTPAITKRKQEVPSLPLARESYHRVWHHGYAVTIGLLSSVLPCRRGIIEYVDQSNLNWSKVTARTYLYGMIKSKPSLISPDRGIFKVYSLQY